jgi:hypothetical protein
LYLFENYDFEKRYQRGDTSPLSNSLYNQRILGIRNLTDSILHSLYPFLSNIYNNLYLPEIFSKRQEMKDKVGQFENLFS